MGRPNVPQWRADRQKWVTSIGGRQVTLAYGRKNLPAARRQLVKLLAAKKPGAGPEMCLWVLCDLFLDHAQRDLAPATYQGYTWKLNQFVAHAGKEISAAEVRPRHLTAWLASRTWNDTTQAQAITVIKAVFSWGKAEGHLDSNPLADMKRPTSQPRRVVPSRTEAAEFLGRIPTGVFGDLLVVLAETGCRPSEAARIEAGMVDLEAGTVTMASKTTRRTGRQRVIYLTDAASEVLRRLMAQYPEGPLLRNARGGPWNHRTMAARFRRAGAAKGMTAGVLRHIFATDGLERGVPIATMAELMGHTSVAMIARTYSRLRDRKDHLREAVRKVRSGEDQGT